MSNNVIVLCVSLMLVVLVGCEKEPPCAPGQLSAEWQTAPLQALVPTQEKTAICSTSADAATFWRPVDVHRANIDAVGVAQDNGWSRVSDNWYDTSGDFNTPKWSEFDSAEGKLRIDVKEVGGGAQIEMKLSK